MKIKAPFTTRDVEVGEQKIAFNGFFRLETLKLRHRLFAGGWGGWLRREVFIRRPAVGVLLIDRARRELVLVEQFRPGALLAGESPWLLEIVAGIVEPGETPEDVARREALEEAGCAVGELIPICDYLSSPGGSSERLILFCAEVEAPASGGIFGLEEEGEDIRLHVIGWDQAYQLLADGEINNAAAVIALQWLQLNEDRFQ